MREAGDRAGVHGGPGLAEKLRRRPGRAVDVGLELALVELADEVAEARGRAAKLGAVMDEEDGGARVTGHAVGATGARPMLARVLAVNVLHITAQEHTLRPFKLDKFIIEQTVRMTGNKVVDDLIMETLASVANEHAGLLRSSGLIH